MILALIGGVAAGKTTLAHALQRELCWPHLGPDLTRAYQGQPYTENWAGLLEQVDALDHCIVESCITPVAYRERLARRESLSVYVVADRAVRLARMRSRGWTAGRVRSAVRLTPLVVAGVPIPRYPPCDGGPALSTLVVDMTEDDPAHAAGSVREHLSAHQAKG